MILAYPFYLLLFMVCFKALRIKPGTAVSVLILLLPWSPFVASKIATGYYCGKVTTSRLHIKNNKANATVGETTAKVEFPALISPFIKGERITFTGADQERLREIIVITDPYFYPFMNTGTGELLFQSKEICRYDK